MPICARATVPIAMQTNAAAKIRWNRFIVELLLLNCAAGLADFSSVEGLRVMQNYQLTGGEAMGVEKSSGEKEHVAVGAARCRK